MEKPVKTPLTNQMFDITAAYQTEQMLSSSTVKLLIDGSNFIKLPMAQQILLTRFGFDYQNPPRTYPYTLYLQIAKYLREMLYDYKSEDEGYEELGYRAIQNYFEGPVGRVIKIAVRAMGPQRSAKQFTANLSKAMPWLDHEIEEVRPGYARYRVKNIPGPPAMMRGVMRSSLEAAGAKATRVSSIKIADDHYIHEIEWK